MPNRLARARRRYLDLQLARLAKRNSFAPEEALIVSSSPRGGSSWLAQTLHQIPRTALLWEPLHLRHADDFRAIGFGWRQHIPEEAEWQEARRALERLFRGNVLNDWIRRGASVRELAAADRVLVKFVRANRLLPWLTKQFAFRRRPLFLVRHPLAVAASQAVRFPPRLNRFADHRLADYERPHGAFLQTLGTWEEILAATWCLTMLPTLRHPANNERWITVTYEHLLVEPRQTLERIFDAWAMPMPPHVLDAVREPSSTTNEATFLQGAEAQLGKWQQQFDAEQIRRLRAVLDYFEVEFYDEGLMPCAAAFGDQVPTPEARVLV
ncbi:MAG: hypothetical protein AAGI91_10955 [Bacteroidota bacterium]